MRVDGTETVDASGELRLSPDGRWLLRQRPEPCVLRLDGTVEQCVDRDQVDGDLSQASWSPDGSKLVFTDDYWRNFREPDVWLFDIASGELRNLTDDSVDKYDISAPDADADIDLLPSWAPDGETVRFVRGAPDSRSVRLMSVDVDGGEPESVREIPCSTNELSALALTEDKVAWSCGIQETEVSIAGMSGDATVTLPAEDNSDRSLLSFSPDGEWLLVDSRAAYADYRSTGGRATVVPTGGGKAVSVAEGSVSYPAWSPSGHAIVYVDLRRPRESDVLKIVDEPGGAPRELHSAKALGAADGVRVGWGGDRLLALVDQKPVLFTLSGS